MKLKRITCLLTGGHKFKLVDAYGRLRVDKCTKCNIHRNIHSGFELFFYSNEERSLAGEIDHYRKLFTKE